MPHLFNSWKQRKTVPSFPNVVISTKIVKEGIDEEGNIVSYTESVPFDYSPISCTPADFQLENMLKAGVTPKEVNNPINSRFGDESGFENAISFLETQNLESNE